MTAQMVQQDETLSLAVRILAGHCDGALALDGEGFAGPDTTLGHRMAVVPESQWTGAQRRKVWEMMQKYAVQLSRYGVNFKAIPVPAKVATDKVIGLVGDNFVLVFKYNDSLVVAVKSFFPTTLRRFDMGTKTWRVPATTRDAAVMIEQFASRYSFTLEAAAEEKVAALKSGRQAAVVVPPSVAPVAVPAKLIDVADGVFVVTFPYSESLVAAVRSLPGRSWDAARKRNTVPFKSAVAISAFAKDNGFTLTPAAKEKVFNMVALAAAMEQEAQQAHRRSVEQREALLAASWAEDASVEVPGLGGTLRPFQRAGVAYALHTERTFIADQPGLGKTCQALAAFQAFDTLVEGASGFPALVIAPAVVKYNWREEARKWLPGKTIKVIKDAADLAGIAEADVVVVNYDIISRAAVLAALLAKKFVSVAADESHYIKERTAQRTKAAIAIATGRLPQKQGSGKRNTYEQVAPPIRFRLALSGTPVKNRPAELISQLEFLGRLDDFGGYRGYTQRYCRPFTEYIRGAAVTNIDGSDNLDELNERLRATCYIRRLKENVLTELPAKTVARIPVKLTNQAEYNQAESDFLTWLRENTAQDRAFLDTIRDLPFSEQMEAIESHVDDKEARARRAEHLVRIESLKQVAARGKLSAAKEWIDDFLASGESLIVFATHRDIIRDIVATYGALSITGDVAAEKRTQIVARFQAGEVKVIVCNIFAGGVGITLTKASNVVFLEQGWSPSDHEQAEDRAHRLTQEATSVNVYYLLADGTIDDTVSGLLSAKRLVVDAATTGGKVSSVAPGSSILTDVLGVYMDKAGVAK